MFKLRNWFIGDYLAKTENVFERARITITYNYAVFFLLIGGVFYINLIARGLWYHVYVITFAMISLISIPFILKYTENVRIAAGWYVIQQIIVSTLEVYLEGAKDDLAGAFFSVAFFLFAFFIYGPKRGMLISLPFVLLVLLGLANKMLGGKLVNPGIPPDQQIPDQPIFVLVPFFFTIYVMWSYVRTRKEAEHHIQKQKALLEYRNKEVTDSITYAERIQKSILPSNRLIQNYFPNSFVVYLPKDIVSGDFYWVEQKGDKVFFAVVDCTGHGVPGAMVSVIGQNSLNRVLNEFNITEPAKMLDKLNELVEEVLSRSGSDIRDGMDIALCSLDKSAMKLEYAGANNALYVLPDGQGLLEYKANKQPIGRFENRFPFTNHEVKLKEGDQVFLFTDGIADQFGGPFGKKFKYKKLKELLLSLQHKNPSEQKNGVIGSFFEWKGKLDQIDDVCVFGVRV